MSQPIDKSLHLRTASEHPDSQQIQLRAAIHFPLDQLQSVDVALGAARQHEAPGQEHEQSFKLGCRTILSRKRERLLALFSSRKVHRFTQARVFTRTNHRIAISFNEPCEAWILEPREHPAPTNRTANLPIPHQFPRPTPRSPPEWRLPIARSPCAPVLLSIGPCTRNRNKRTEHGS